MEAHMVNPEHNQDPEEIYLSFLENSINMRLKDRRKSEAFSTYLQMKRLLDAKNFLLTFTANASSDIGAMEDKLQSLSSEAPGNEERIEALREDIDLRKGLLRKYHPYFLNIIDQLIDAEEERLIPTTQLQ
jgi:hypothetical protein